MVKRQLFGTDGIRGVANREPMTCERITRLGMAIGRRVQKESRHGRVVIGKDTRVSGYMFETAIAAGVVATGADVWLTGPLPTPAIAFITSSMRADAGVVISASHNPYSDNGIKIFARDGYKLDDQVEADIEALMDTDDLQALRAAPENIGYSTRIDDAQGRYVVYCKGTFPKALTLDGLKIVVDSAHGAAYRVAPSVFEELGAHVISIHAKPNGKNINKDAGALSPEVMAKRVVAEGAHLGIALDGDADRVVMCDEKGAIIDGDTVMALCATRMLQAKALAKNTLVTTVMSNIGLERAITAAGGTLLRTQVGDRYVVDAMRHGGYNFGGEQSGHLVFLDHATTGDGIIAALRTLEFMVKEERALSDLTNVMVAAPQVLVNVEVAKKLPLEEMPKVCSLIASVEEKLGDEGRVLVRYSGTESKARVMIEGPDGEIIQGWAQEIAHLIQNSVSS